MPTVSQSSTRSTLFRVTPIKIAIVSCVGLYLLLAIPLSFPIKNFCGDEGFYALAARNVMQGVKPYRDFLYPQMPLVAYAYAAWFSIFGMSVESGRVLSLTMTALAITFVMLACHRRVGLWPAVFAGLLWSTAIYTATDLGFMKSQSLCNFLIAAALLAIPTPDADRRLARAALAMGLMSLAFFTRLTLVIPLFVLWVYLAWECRSEITRYLLLVAANIAILAIVIAFFWSDGNMWFGVYVTHHDFYGDGPWTWERLGWTVTYSLRNQLVIATFLLAAVIRFCGLLTDRSTWPELAFPTFCLGCYAAVTLAHWSQVQNYPTHQTVITSFAITFIALVLAPAIKWVAEQHLVSGGIGLALFVAICSPFSEGGIAPLIDRAGKHDWLKEALGILARHAKPGDEMLSFNVELAFHGGYSVFPGCEASEWSYLGDVPDELAKKRKVLNLLRLAAAIGEETSPILTFTDRDFATMSDDNAEIGKQLEALIVEHYRQVGVVEKYGQFGQELFIFKRMGKSPRP